MGAGSDVMNDGAPGMLEQAETPRLQTAMMTIFFMVVSIQSCGWPPRHGHDATVSTTATHGSISFTAVSRAQRHHPR
jgi:hypothetical protein